MPRVRVAEERETAQGWRFDVLLEGETDGDERGRIEVRLSFVDYDHISGGSASPARVVEALVAALLDRGRLDELGGSFDVAKAARLSDDMVAALRERL